MKLLEELAKGVLWIGLALIIGKLIAATANGDTYHIGNSLTYDSISQQPMMPDHHGWGGHSLDQIWNDPNASNFNQGGLWPTALLGNYDSVVLQPHLSQQSTLNQDLAAYANFRAYAPHIDTWYWQQTWPRQSFFDPDYASVWLSDNATNGQEEILTRQRRSYWNEHTEGWIIPTGEVFYELEQAGYDLSEFYRDDVHASFDLGRYVANLTLASTISRAPAIDIGHQADLDRIITDVVLGHVRSGYADYNADGTVDRQDLQVWETSGTTGLNFLAWQLQLGGNNQGLSAHVVPEPSGWASVFVYVVFIYRLCKDFH